jgi:gas vesicle protein
MANGLFRGLLAGALVGATAALLFAPNKGEVTRRSLKEKGNEYFEAVREKVKRDGSGGTS